MSKEKKPTLTPLAAALGATLAISLSAAPMANADTGTLFAAEPASKHVSLVGGGSGKEKEGDCGHDMDGDCADGMDADCADDMDADCADDGDDEGTCGEGSCGTNM